MQTFQADNDGELPRDKASTSCFVHFKVPPTRSNQEQVIIESTAARFLKNPAGSRNQSNKFSKTLASTVHQTVSKVESRPVRIAILSQPIGVRLPQAALLYVRHDLSFARRSTLENRIDFFVCRLQGKRLIAGTIVTLRSDSC